VFSIAPGYGVNKNVPPYSIVRGPSLLRGVNLVGLRRAGFKREVIKEIKEVYTMLSAGEKTGEEVLSQVKQKYASDEIKHLVSFIENSKRGICTFGTSARNKFFDSPDWAD